ncbi:hypothetical protein ACSSV8_002627, partial [Roseovarius sp. MBR-79]
SLTGKALAPHLEQPFLRSQTLVFPHNRPEGDIRPLSPARNQGVPRTPPRERPTAPRAGAFSTLKPLQSFQYLAP